uniref:Uncharacterized protein n=1 Tax=Oryza brachyantha TaxID=4533 RepID=J3LZ74_ORYBR
MLSQRGKILAVLVLFVVVSSTVEAARLLPGEQGGHATTTTTTTVSLHERARSLLMAWVAQLTSGPSPKGPGH